jgi:hypothetical protein
MAVQLSVFLVPQVYDVPTRTLVRASLIIAGVWVALASAIFAAGPRSTLSGLLRGGCVVDATAVLLIVLWLRTPQVTFASAAKLYCIYASVALCSISAARCAATPRFRYLGAVFTGAMLTAMQGSLFWLPGLLQLAPSGYKSALAGAGLRANPLYGVFSATANESRFVWHYADAVMYRITPLGEDIVVPPVQWYEPMTIYLIIAGVLTFAVVLRSRSVRSGSRGEVISQ